MNFYILYWLVSIIFLNHHSNGFTTNCRINNGYSLVNRYYMNLINKDELNNNNRSDDFKTTMNEETDMVKLLKNYKKNPGFDETYVYNKTIDNEIIKKIKISLINFDLLRKLNSSSISENTKLALINENRHLFEETRYSVNIEAGGLFKDWEFTIL